MAEPYRVLLVEDDPDFVYLIRQAIARCDQLQCVGAAHSGGEGVAMALAKKPHVALMDLQLPGGIDGVQAARAIRLQTDARVLMLTSCEEPETVVRASTQAFASGYLFKSQCQSLTDAVLSTAQGATASSALIRELALAQLSPTERSVVSMLLTGDVALSSAEKTIANQKTSIFKKLGLHSTAELQHVFRRW